MKYVTHVLVTAAFLGILSGCGRKVTVEARDHRPVRITRDGRLTFESEPMTEADLVALVADRLERDRQSGVPSQYSLVLIQPDGDTPYAKVRSVGDIIAEAGGCVGHPLSPRQQSSEVTPHVAIWNEYRQREDRPIPSDSLFKELEQQRLRLKSSGALFLDGQEITEEQLISLARKRVYLRMADGEPERHFDSTMFTMVVDADTPYRHVERVEAVLSLNHCLVGVSVAKEEKGETRR